MKAGTLRAQRWLVIYYSFEGSCQVVANQLATDLGAEVCELKPVQEPVPHGWRKYLCGGWSVFSKSCPKLMNVVPSFDDFDGIILGTPVWAGSYTPAMRSFIKKYGSLLEGKSVALFCCHRGGKGRFFRKVQAALPEFSLVDEADFEVTKLGTSDDLKAAVTRWSEKLNFVICEGAKV